MRLSSRLSDKSKNSGEIESFIDWEKYTTVKEEETEEIRFISAGDFIEIQIGTITLPFYSTACKDSVSFISPKRLHCLIVNNSMISIDCQLRCMDYEEDNPKCRSCHPYVQAWFLIGVDDISANSPRVSVVKQSFKLPDTIKLPIETEDKFSEWLGKAEIAYKERLGAGAVIYLRSAFEQINRLPTGCETCSAVMVLQYYGYPVSETEFADKYLKRGNLFYQNGRLYGPDPNSKFIGSPYTSSSYGILANGMAASINQYLKDTAHQAKSLHGESVEKLCQEYIGKGDPVMLWATINMMKSGKSTFWIISDTDENSIYNKGDVFTWTTQEHCLVLTGYDESSYYFNDPWIGKAVSYPRETVEARYQEMGSQAVVIIKK